MSLASKIAQSIEIIDAALAIHKPSHVFGMFSGGHDSLCATHLISQHPSFTRAVHINTTIGIEQTRQFVRDTARDRQWKLLEYSPPVSYRDIVLQHGFPGPGGHRFMYIRLKEKCVDRLVREHKTHWKDRIGLVTGVRLSESVRRMGHVEPVKRDGAQLWLAPILHWDDDDKLEYMEMHSLTRNAVVDTICMSGECLCGAFAKKEELLEIEYAFPETAAVIHALQKEAEAAGVHCKWGTRPPGTKGKATAGGMMCSSCNQRNLPFMEAV